MTAADDAPLILTAMLDEASQAWFDAERQRYFPARLNHIPAHVTLFHHLPGRERPALERDLAQACQHCPASPFATTGLRFLGYGTAYALDMPGLASVRRRLAAAWEPWLTKQDRQSWRPHVTIQNKAPADEAKRLHAALLAGFVPRSGLVNGLSLWRYCGGPWQGLGQHRFAAQLPLPDYPCITAN